MTKEEYLDFVKTNKDLTEKAIAYFESIRNSKLNITKWEIKFDSVLIHGVATFEDGSRYWFSQRPGYIRNFQPAPDLIVSGLEAKVVTEALDKLNMNYSIKEAKK